MLGKAPRFVIILCDLCLLAIIILSFNGYLSALCLCTVIGSLINQVTVYTKTVSSDVNEEETAIKLEHTYVQNQGIGNSSLVRGINMLHGLILVLGSLVMFYLDYRDGLDFNEYGGFMCGMILVVGLIIVYDSSKVSNEVKELEKYKKFGKLDWQLVDETNE